jgi:hypothetical protein
MVPARKPNIHALLQDMSLENRVPLAFSAGMPA